MPSTPLPALIFQTGPLIAARILLFLFSERVVIRALRLDLQSLPSPPSSSESIPLDDFDVLPTPITTTFATNRRGGGDERGDTWNYFGWAKSLFSLSFAESCTLFLLFLCQFLEILGDQTSDWNSAWSISILVLSALVAVPLAMLVMIVLGTMNRLPTKFSITLIGLSYAVYLYGLTHIPVDNSAESQGHLTSWLSRLLAVGTVVLGILTGVGVVQTISSSWTWLINSRSVVSQDDLNNAERALRRCREDLASKMREFGRMNDGGISPSEPPSFVRRMFKFQGSAISSLESEISALRTLESHLFNDYIGLQESRSRSRQSWIIKSANHIFTAYCVVRIASSTRNLFFAVPSSSPDDYAGPSSPDLMAHVISLLLSQVEVEINVNALAYQMSLLFIGIIITMNIRFVLGQCNRVLRISGKKKGISFMILLCTQLMVAYMLATLIQLTSTFPNLSEGHSGTSPGEFSLWSLPRFSVFGRVFDCTFLLTVLAGSLPKLVARVVNGSGYE